MARHGKCLDPQPVQQGNRVHGQDAAVGGAYFALGQKARLAEAAQVRNHGAQPANVQLFRHYVPGRGIVRPAMQQQDGLAVPGAGIAKRDGKSVGLKVRQGQLPLTPHGETRDGRFGSRLRGKIDDWRAGCTGSGNPRIVTGGS